MYVLNRLQEPFVTWERTFQRTSRYLSLVVLALGCLVTLGWMLNVSWLKNLLPGLVEMKANTALGFIGAGAALYLIQAQRDNQRLLNVSRGLALAVLLLGLLTLAEHFLGVNLGIDELLFDDPVSNPSAFPGRMATPTALNFFLLGVAIWMLYLPTMIQP
jgi:methyl-accepting chemotaxis protein